MLFDVEPDLEGFMPEGMAGTEYLIRSLRPEMQNVRNMISQWFSYYPAEEKKAWKSAFFSYKKNQHNSAFFELFLHETLRRSGWELTIHPEVAGSSKRPDFLCRKDEFSFYIEAKVATGKSEQEEKAITRMETVMEQINRKVKSQFFSLWIETDGLPDKVISSHRWVKNLNAWLDTLDYELCLQQDSNDDRPKYLEEEAGLKICFEAFPKPEPRESESILSAFMYGHEGGIITPHAPIRDAIERKANRYGANLERPYIIAVNALGMFTDVVRDTLDALYGNQVIRYRMNVPGGDAEPARDNSGSFCFRGERRKPQVPAALVFANIHPCVTYQNAKGLYVPNVSAAFPLETPLPHLSYMQDAENRLALHDGGAVGQLLGIPEDWPHSAAA